MIPRTPHRWLAVTQRRDGRLAVEIRVRRDIRAGVVAPMGRATVTATISYPRTGRQDPANAGPTVKALIDGCVDAGLLPDDDAEHLPAVTFRRGCPTRKAGQYVVTLGFEEES